MSGLWLISARLARIAINLVSRGQKEKLQFPKISFPLRQLEGSFFIKIRVSESLYQQRVNSPGRLIPHFSQSIDSCFVIPTWSTANLLRNGAQHLQRAQKSRMLRTSHRSNESEQKSYRTCQIGLESCSWDAIYCPNKSPLRLQSHLLALSTSDVFSRLPSRKGSVLSACQNQRLASDKRSVCVARNEDNLATAFSSCTSLNVPSR